MTGPAAAAPSGTFAVLREAASNADLRRLQLGNVAWGSGEAAYVIGLTVVVFQLGGTAAVAILALVRALPSVILAPILTSLLDRLAPSVQLRAVLAVRVLVVVALMAALLAGADVLVLLVLAGIDAVAATLLRPIRGALVPALARSPEELVAGNVATTTGDSLAALVGPAIAAAILTISDPSWTLVAGVALLAAALVAGLRLRDRSAGPSAGAGIAQHPRQAGGASLLAGLRDLARLPHARWIVALFVAQRFVRGAFAVLVVAAAIDLVRLGEPGVGWLSGAVGLGGLAGGAVALGLVSRRRLVPAFLAGIVMWGLGIALPGLAPIAPVALITLAAAGVGKVVLDVAGFSLLQRTVPTEVRGRVLGTLEGLVTASLALGSLAAAWLIDVAGIAVAMVIVGAVPIVAVLLAWLPLRAADDAAVISDRAMKALREVPFFRPLGLNALERLSTALHWQHVEAGAVIVREGETGDRFYIVESGRVEVSSGGAPVRRLAAGDSFGEIALLRTVPRTATVTAVEPTTLGAIEGAAFIAAITGHDASAAAASSHMDARMESERSAAAECRLNERLLAGDR